jgi:hypothetical protein
MLLRTQVQTITRRAKPVVMSLFVSIDWAITVHRERSFGVRVACEASATRQTSSSASLVMRPRRARRALNRPPLTGAVRPGTTREHRDTPDLAAMHNARTTRRIAGKTAHCSRDGRALRPGRLDSVSTFSVILHAVGIIGTLRATASSVALFLSDTADLGRKPRFDDAASSETHLHRYEIDSGSAYRRHRL